MSTSNPASGDYYPNKVVVGNGVVFMVLPIIFVGLRFYARRVARTIIGIDDWCIVVASRVELS
ncbi:MAG: hypothetical protein Q9188_003718 [Gyalolechia gomerana]